MKYRSELDGLRAVAVVPVILFHAGVPAMGGGFVGVDVFLVLSGYLISTILLSELAAGRFSWPQFLERRARRLLPALIFVCALSVPVAWWVLLPLDFKEFLQSLGAVASFTANVFFWRKSDYFDGPAELKPLLHTWSLSLEEQFYFFFPLLLLVIWRYGRQWLLPTLGLGALLSLALAEYASIHHPVANFFLLPTRAWELCIGAMVAVLDSSGEDVTPSDTLASCGLLGILSGILFLSAATPFPGLYALAPTLGTALVIRYGRAGTKVHTLLSIRPLVLIGLVSYSLYLWHQPVFALARGLSHDLHDRGVFAISLVLVAVGSAFSYLAIERPFRDRDRVSKKQVWVVAGASTALALSLAAAGHYTNGFERSWIARRPPEVRTTYGLVRLAQQEAGFVDDGACRFLSRGLSEETIARMERCRSTFGPGLVVLGDSHGVDLFGALALARPEQKFMVGIAADGCRPHAPDPDCHYDPFLQLVASRSELVAQVVFEQAGFYLIRNKNEQGTRRLFNRVPLSGSVSEELYPDAESLVKVGDYLEQLAKFVPTTWLGPRVEPHVDFREVVRHNCASGLRLRAGQERTFAALDSAAGSLLQSSRVRYVSQVRSVIYDFESDYMTCDGIYWRDGDHYSARGLVHFGPRISAALSPS